MDRRRKVFSIIKPIITIAALIFSFFGRKLNYYFFTIFRNTPGYLGKLIRYVFLKNCLKKLGDNVVFGPGVHIKWPERITIGENVSVNEMCYLEGFGSITIGNDVAIAHATTIMTSNHSFKDTDKIIRLNPIIGEPIIIEDDIWIGCGVRILAGVHLKQRTVVAAGAVVNKSFDGHTLLGGVPARVLKNI